MPKPNITHKQSKGTPPASKPSANAPPATNWKTQTVNSVVRLDPSLQESLKQLHPTGYGLIDLLVSRGDSP